MVYVKFQYVNAAIIKTYVYNRRRENMMRFKQIFFSLRDARRPQSLQVMQLVDIYIVLNMC